MTLIEAMANARACVATAVGGVVDLLGGVAEEELRRPHPWQICERGVQVRPGDPEAFAEALARVVSDPVLRRTLGERGREYVERNYSVERLLADVQRLYGRLAGGAGEAAAESALLKF